ncbi:hypothetical protein DEO72_LG8g2845 [Vigna unguiculata]|uniref:Uncharacterized protein n=1 Tax=Vigna unguiculata TaxID=3917 RepID=A0A4D6MVN2_VIGUN|nr:hypothetical protein DEO72_LG8g2845 [Vigna unguiculata]
MSDFSAVRVIARLENQEYKMDSKGLQFVDYSEEKKAIVDVAVSNKELGHAVVKEAFEELGIAYKE